MSINERKDKTGTIKEVDLGLSDSETQALNECRRHIADDADLNDMRDATLARYLRHNSWSVEPALKQLKEYLAWRKANNIDHILDKHDFKDRDLIRTIVPHAYHQFDKQGRPIYLEKTGLIATAALADEKITNPDSFLHSHIYGLEMLQRRMHEKSLERKERVNGICTILDLTGLGFGHRNCLMVLKRCMDFDSKYYPEYLDKLYVINSPWMAPYIYQAVQVFLHPITKSRIQIVSGEPNAFLAEHIAPENLPSEYGGTCTGDRCDCGGSGKGGPLNLKGCCDVLDASELKAAEVEGLDSQVVAYDFEKTVSSSADACDTFTWYFEVADGMDIDFSVELLPVSGAREADESKRVKVVKVERLRTGRGSYQAPYPGAKLLFRWDNNFSWMNSKAIRYTVASMQADDVSTQQLAQAKAAQ